MAAKWPVGAELLASGLRSTERVLGMVGTEGYEPGIIPGAWQMKERILDGMVSLLYSVKIWCVEIVGKVLPGRKWSAELFVITNYEDLNIFLNDAKVDHLIGESKCVLPRNFLPGAVRILLSVPALIPPINSAFKA